MIISLIFIFAILKYIERNFISPLNIISNNVKKIKDGDLSVDFATKSENKEIKETFNVLNDMTQGLKQKDQLYDNFIQNIVHDLRAPVIAQERAMEILSEEFSDNPLVSGLVSNNDAFLKMVNEIIEALSKKDIKINKEKINLKKSVNSVIEAIKPVLEEKNIQVYNNVQDGFTVYADYICLNRIIANLVSNAVEHIGNDKHIKVYSDKSKDMTQIFIEDDGDGIADTESIFKKYSSSNKSGKKAVSGLGLSIVSELVKKNNGNIRVESELKKYTKFIIGLPNEEN